MSKSQIPNAISRRIAGVPGVHWIESSRWKLGFTGVCRLSKENEFK